VILAHFDDLEGEHRIVIKIADRQSGPFVLDAHGLADLELCENALLLRSTEQKKIEEKERLVAEAKKIAAAKAKGKVPLTLKDVGAAEGDTLDADRFAYLDKLDGAALEEAMGKMSEADMAAYAKEN